MNVYLWFSLCFSVFTLKHFCKEKENYEAGLKRNCIGFQMKCFLDGSAKDEYMYMYFLCSGKELLRLLSSAWERTLSLLNWVVEHSIIRVPNKHTPSNGCETPKAIIVSFQINCYFHKCRGKKKTGLRPSFQLLPPMMWETILNIQLSTNTYILTINVHPYSCLGFIFFAHSGSKHYQILLVFINLCHHKWLIPLHSHYRNTGRISCVLVLGRSSQISFRPWFYHNFPERLLCIQLNSVSCFFWWSAGEARCTVFKSSGDYLEMAPLHSIQVY